MTANLETQTMTSDGTSDFRPAYLLALRTWLTLAGLVIAAIWTEAQLTGTLTDYLRVAGPVFGPIFLAMAVTVHLKPALADRVAFMGFVALALYFSLAYAFAIVVGPWAYSFLIFANAIWISALYLYSSLFLGRLALRADIAVATTTTVLSLVCLLRFNGADADGHAGANVAMQPYVYALLAQWAMIPGAMAINHLYRAMRDSQRKVALLRQVVAEMVGHEIGTPLQAIVNHIELLQLLQSRLIRAPASSDNAAKASRVIENLRRSVQQVQSVLDNAAEALKTDGREFDATASADEVCLVKLLEETVAEFKGRAAERGLMLWLDCSEPIPADVIVDRTRLTQIVSNLVSNAIKYSDQGQVVVRATSIGRGHVHIQVSDTGIGIPAESLEEIWEPYVRLPQALQRGVKGSGLGLAVVKREISILGGRIDLQSVLGQGSQFTCIIPATVRSFACRRLDSNRMPSVLIVDDSNILLGAASQLFESLRVDCAIAEDGHQALALLSCQRFDIVFLDIQLPGIDGFEVAQRLRKDACLSANRFTPLIAMSAEEPTTSLRDAQCFNFFLKKPFAFTSHLLGKHLIDMSWADVDDMPQAWTFVSRQSGPGLAARG